MIRHITPKLVCGKRKVYGLYDAGEIYHGLSGAWHRMPRQGTEITVVHGELLNKKGRLVKENTYKQKTVFYTDGTEREDALPLHLVWLPVILR